MKKGTVRQNVKEADEQKAIFQWAKLKYSKFPELEWCLFSIPNGGSRHKLEAYNLKLQGTKSGVSDMTLQVARGGYHGLWIELKVGKNKTTKNQDKFLESMKREGYYTKICYGSLEAIATIQNYLNSHFYREDAGE